MKAPSSTDRLGRIRQEIDMVDQELLAILNRRAALSIEVGQIKANDTSSILRPERELEVLAQLDATNAGPLPSAHIRAIWREIFSSSRALQKKLRTAYLGPEGTFSYFAATQSLGSSVELHACTDFEDVFRAVGHGQCQLGVIPLENSLQGTVGQCFDLFYRWHVSIQAELFVRISHSLLSTHMSVNHIRRIYSHPQALAQCTPWLRINVPWASTIPVESTGAAAHRAAEDAESAAIGHMSLAEMLPLRVLAESIESSNDNWTRFVIIAQPNTDEGKTPALPLSNMALGKAQMKSSVLFTLHDKPGSLALVLQALAQYRVNMRKLESRPLHLSGAQSWQYVFFADLETDFQASEYAPLMDVLRSLCSSFRVLGVYPSVPPAMPARDAIFTTDTMLEGIGGNTC